jgi:hypothetical protein
MDEINFKLAIRELRFRGPDVKRHVVHPIGRDEFLRETKGQIALIPPMSPAPTIRKLSKNGHK